MTAAFSGYVDFVDLLLHKGASPDLTDNDGERALMSGSKSGHAAIVRLLLNAGADPNTTDLAGRNAVIWAVSRGDYPDVLDILIKAGIDINSTAKDGTTALIRAVLMGICQVNQHPNKRRGQPRCENNEGKTALSLAAGSGSLEIAEQLRRAGAAE